MLIAATLIAYHNSFGGAFQLDDKVRIIGNTDIRQVWPPWLSMAGSSRPLVYFTLAINYAIDGLNVGGYHAFNLVIHILAGLTLFGIVHRMLSTGRMRMIDAAAAPWLAAAAALLWLVHPLQTQSVTYIIQRAESMMGLFLMLTLYFAIRSASSPHPQRWQWAAIVACAMGMGSKEVMVVAPLIVLLYDRVFLSATFVEALRRRPLLYTGLAATWLILAFVLVTSRVDEQQMMIEDLTPLRYALSQPGIVVHYLRLAFWPSPLVLDYAWPTAESPAAIVPPAILLLVLLAATAFALYRRHWAGFWGAWFFLVLAPTSSILPIADLAFEHRMYVPLAAVVVLAVIGVYELVRRASTPPAAAGSTALAVLVVAAAVALAAVTIRRNDDYRSEQAMWADIVAKRPENPRAHYNLGNIFDRAGKQGEAIEQYREAVRLKPTYVDAHVNWGAVQLARGELPDAITHLTEAVRLKPDSSQARNNLGAALFTQGKVAEALPHLEANVRLNPNSAGAHYNLASALNALGRFDQANEHYASAVRLDPRYARAHNDWGAMLLRQGRLGDAISHFTAATAIDPGYAEARNNLAAARAREARGDGPGN